MPKSNSLIAEYIRFRFEDTWVMATTSVSRLISTTSIFASTLCRTDSKSARFTPARVALPFALTNGSNHCKSSFRLYTNATRSLPTPSDVPTATTIWTVRMARLYILFSISTRQQFQALYNWSNCRYCWLKLPLIVVPKLCFKLCVHLLLNILRPYNYFDDIDVDFSFFIKVVLHFTADFPSRDYFINQLAVTIIVI